MDSINSLRQAADELAQRAMPCSNALGVSEACVRNTAYLHRDRFPRRSANGAPRKLDYELAYRLHAKGVSAEAIAERAGVSTRTVTRALMCVALERRSHEQRAARHAEE